MTKEKETNSMDALKYLYLENWNDEMLKGYTSILKTGSEAILIVDEQFRKLNSPFVQWLRSEGFHYGFHHGNYGDPWMYVNLTAKLYAYGMPGISVIQPTGNHAITISQFKKIYAIYKKYEGHDIFDFHGGQFDYNSSDDR